MTTNTQITKTNTNKKNEIVKNANALATVNNDASAPAPAPAPAPAIQYILIPELKIARVSSKKLDTSNYSALIGTCNDRLPAMSGKTKIICVQKNSAIKRHVKRINAEFVKNTNLFEPASLKSYKIELSDTLPDDFNLEIPLRSANLAYNAVTIAQTAQPAQPVETAIEKEKEKQENVAFQLATAPNNTPSKTPVKKLAKKNRSLNNTIK